MPTPREIIETQILPLDPEAMDEGQVNVLRSVEADLTPEERSKYAPRLDASGAVEAAPARKPARKPKQ